MLCCYVVVQCAYSNSLVLLLCCSLCQAEVEKRMVAPLQEGEEPKSATAIVAEVLTAQHREAHSS